MTGPTARRLAGLVAAGAATIAGAEAAHAQERIEIPLRCVAGSTCNHGDRAMTLLTDLGEKRIDLKVRVEKTWSYASSRTAPDPQKGSCTIQVAGHGSQVMAMKTPIPARLGMTHDQEGALVFVEGRYSRDAVQAWVDYEIDRSSTSSTESDCTEVGGGDGPALPPDCEGTRRGRAQVGFFGRPGALSLTQRNLDGWPRYRRCPLPLTDLARTDGFDWFGGWASHRAADLTGPRIHLRNAHAYEERIHGGQMTTKVTWEMLARPIRGTRAQGRRRAAAGSRSAPGEPPARTAQAGGDVEIGFGRHPDLRAVRARVRCPQACSLAIAAQFGFQDSAMPPDGGIDQDGQYVREHASLPAVSVTLPAGRWTTVALPVPEVLALDVRRVLTQPFGAAEVTLTARRDEDGPVASTSAELALVRQSPAAVIAPRLTRRSFAVRALCDRGPGGCVGTLRLTTRVGGRTVGLGTRRYAIGSGGSSVLKLSVPATGRRVLGRARRARVTMTFESMAVNMTTLKVEKVRARASTTLPVRR